MNFRSNSLVRIAVVFAVVFTVLESFIWGLGLTDGLNWLMNGTAQVAAVLVRGVGIPVTVVGNQMALASRILQIDVDCTALAIAAVYVALVVAYPLAVRTKMLALVVGIPVIAVTNLLRLVAVAVASEHLSPALFSFVHDYLFKVVMVLVVVGLWAAWLEIARSHAETA